MARRATPALLGLAIIAASSAACTTPATRAREVKEGLIGMKAVEIRHCMGDPTSLDWDDTSEVMVYSWVPPLSLERQEEERRREMEPYIPDALRNRTPEEERRERFRWEAFCELKVTLEKKRVAAVEADGRSERGLRLDDQCMIKAKRCLPEKADQGS